MALVSGNYSDGKPKIFILAGFIFVLNNHCKMLTVISDDDLRLMLSKYMDSVPPVTVTTRPILMKRLEKYVTRELELVNSKDTSVDDSMVSDEPKSPKRDVLAVFTDILSERVTRKFSESTIPEDVPLSPKKSSPSPRVEQLFLSQSPVQEFASRLPTYRRRSIHPERPGLCSPYSEFHLPESLVVADRSKLQSPSEKLTLFASRDTLAKNWPPKMHSVVLGTMTTFLQLPISIFRGIKGHFRTDPLSTRILLVVLGLAVIVLFLTWALLGDPFYYNPVNDFKNILPVRQK